MPEDSEGRPGSDSAGPGVPLGQRLLQYGRSARPVAARVARSTLFLATALAVLTWPIGTPELKPIAGLDPSWHAALAMAAHYRIPFGTRAVFTYGPLGFLAVPALYYPMTAALSFVFHLVVAIGAFSVVLGATRRHMPLLLAFTVSYVAGFALLGWLPGDEAALCVALALSVDRLSRPAGDRRREWQWAVLGVLAAVLALEKLSLGAGVIALTLIAIACARGNRLRSLALVAAPATATFTIVWFATGGGFGNLWPYIRTAREISIGYTAMSSDPVPPAHDDLALAALATVAILAAALAFARYLAGPERARVRDFLRSRTTIGLVLTGALTSWILFKESFIRQGGHRLAFFGSVPLILAAYVFGADRDEPSPRPWITRNSTTLGVVLLVFAFIPYVVLGVVPSSLADPVRSVRRFSGNVMALVSPGRGRSITAAARADLAKVYRLPPGMLARIQGRKVSVDPYEQTLVWTYPSIRWDPLPVLQDYAAYTVALDRLDANFLASRNAPHFILRQRPFSFDGRLPYADPPATQIAIACYYHQVGGVTDSWQLVERGANRCDAPKQVARVDVRFGDQITVPTAKPGEMIVATFDFHESLAWHLVDLAYKPPIVSITIEQARRHNRFVIGTAASPHLFQPPDNLGYAPSFTPPAITSFWLSTSGASLLGAHVTVTFFSLAVH